MKYSGRAVGVGIAIALGLAGPAAAQAPGQSEPAIARALEKQLADRLAASGIVLARHNLGLLVEPLTDHWTVSLVDLETGRPVVAARVDHLPTDPDAAVAALIRVVAVLEEQIAPRRARPEPAAPEPPGPRSAEQRALRAQRREAELAFQQHALRFAPSYDLAAQTAPHGDRDWRVYRGGVDQRLDPQEFYRVVGRDDLAQGYVLRQRLIVGGYAATGVAFAVAAVLGGRQGNLHVCDGLPVDRFDQCVSDHSRPLTPVLVAAGLGLVGAAFGTYVYRHPHPVDENDAKALADAYNQRLRGQLGLPVASERPFVRDVALTALVAGRDTELVLGGRF